MSNEHLNGASTVRSRILRMIQSGRVGFNASDRRDDDQCDGGEPGGVRASRAYGDDACDDNGICDVLHSRLCCRPCAFCPCECPCVTNGRANAHECRLCGHRPYLKRTASTLTECNTESLEKTSYSVFYC